MANIKISELNELEQVDNDDLLVIVDTSSNETKKVKAENVPSNLEIHDSYNSSTTEPYSCNYVNNLHTYSTNEVRIGTWINGKPLYRKVISVTLTNGFASSSSFTQNVEHAHILCSWADNGSGVIMQLPVANVSSNWQIRPVINTNFIQIQNNNADYVGKIAYVVVEYTKTTD